MKDRLLSLGSLFGGIGAALTSAAASICCIGPLGIAILGVNGSILAAGLKPYRAYLLAASAALLALAFWSVYRRRPRQGEACPTRFGRLTRVVLWMAAVSWVGAVVIQFMADRYWL